MAQQPNVESTADDLPRPTPQPGPAVSAREAKPGIPRGPADVPRGGPFGTTGPDPGYALKLLSTAELPDDDPRLRKVVNGLMLARSAVLGRAPVPEDIEVALVMLGFFEDAPKTLIDRRERWLAAVPHEIRPGETAVAEIDRSVFVNKPREVEYLLKRRPHGVESR